MELSVEELPDMLCEDERDEHRDASASPRDPPGSCLLEPYPYLLFAALCRYLSAAVHAARLKTATREPFDGAVRILHGQVFARDFFEVMGPGTFYLLAAFFKLFGATFLAVRIWLFVTSLGTVSIDVLSVTPGVRDDTRFFLQLCW